MISDIYTLTRFQTDFREIPEETERTARYEQLDSRSALRLRLLAEELICMMPQLLIYGKGSFWIESHKKCYTLRLQVTPDAADFDTSKVIAVSSSGKNASAKGIVGRMTAAVEQLLAARQKKRSADPYGAMSSGFCDYDEQTIWSLQEYKNGFDSEDKKKQKAEEWDELEKSIIANLADDVTVGVLGGKVDIAVKKQF